MKKQWIAVVAMMLCASLALANGGHGGMGEAAGGPHGEGFGPGGHLTVATDGTVLIERSVTTNGTTSEELVAIRNGATAWTAALPDHARVELSGAQVIEVIHTTATGATSPATTLTALSVSTGAQAWTLNIDGAVTEVEPFNGGTYAVVVKPAATTGGTATRSLVAISTTGTILWSVTL